MLKYLNSIYRKQLLNPTLLSIFINPFYLIRRGIYKKIKEFAPNCTGNLLDLGCGSKPYKGLFVNCDKYIGIDIQNEGHSHQNEDVDVYYDGKILPFADNSFDSIFSSEVFEHIFEPNLTLFEVNRVLKKNAKVLFVVPFVWDEHEIPNDYGRYTQFGLKYIFEKHGFKVLSLIKDSHFNVVTAQLRILYIHNRLFTSNKYLNILINIIFIAPLTIGGIIKSAILPKDKKLYFNTIILAEKIDNKN